MKSLYGSALALVLFVLGAAACPSMRPLPLHGDGSAHTDSAQDRAGDGGMGVDGPFGAEVATSDGSSPSTCSPNPCSNGGICTDNNGTFRCACSGAFTGSKCELPRFQPIEQLRAVVGISADGAALAGLASAGSGDPAHWTLAGSLVMLGALPGGVSPTAYAISGDGKVVVGTSGAQPASLARAVRWTPPLSVADLGQLPNTNTCRAMAVSHDGVIVAGYCFDIGTGTLRPFRLDGAGMAAISMLPGSYGCDVAAMTDDGSTIAGACNSSGPKHPFRWTAAGTLDLGILPGSSNCSATAISDDGQVVFGVCDARAFMWKPTSGMTELTTLSGRTSPAPKDTSADGSVIVGVNSVSGALEAIMWDNVHGVRTMHSVLQAAGISLTGWTLQTANGVTPDGKTVVGHGVSPSGTTEVWLARLP